MTRIFHPLCLLAIISCTVVACSTPSPTVSPQNDDDNEEELTESAEPSADDEQPERDVTVTALIEAYGATARESGFYVGDQYTEDPAHSEESREECSTNSDCPNAECVSRNDLENMDCAATEQCREDGLCTVMEYSGYGSGRRPANLCSDTEVCGAASDAECQQSTSCPENGNCAAATYRVPYNKCYEEPCHDLVYNRCIPTPESCAESTDCAVYGFCGAGYGAGQPRCEPMADLHCEQSEQCRQFGNCSYVDWSTHYCVPAEETHCRESVACSTEGRCSMPEHVGSVVLVQPTTTYCVALTDEDCQASDLCAQEGRCVARDERCVIP